MIIALIGYIIRGPCSVYRQLADSSCHVTDTWLGILVTFHAPPCSCLTTEDERRQLGAAACSLVQRVQLTDSDAQLRLLVSVRAALSALPSVLSSTVHASLRLVLDRHRHAPARWVLP